ncbi:putative signaling protein [Rhodoplanes serenus]|uniref:Signaling protein n=1 Tax=Rhodoplanes serenus TaxID=200615 RepID=A0A3S4FFE7_9BRAD|nr:EAL domain-containing protein [Rhodoplanes serenus]VCU10932.1 putative signaling protein [Rhodoplanes serenus]
MIAPKPPLSFRILIALAGLAICVAAGAVGITLDFLRKESIRGAERESMTVARLITSELIDTIAPIDSLLIEIRDVAPELGIVTPEQLRAHFATPHMVQFFHDRLVRVPAAQVIRISAVDGTLASVHDKTGPVDPGPAYDVAAPGRVQDASGLIVSRPFTSHGITLFYMSRRIHNASGEPVGFVSVGVDLRLLQHIESAFASFNGRSFIVSRTDGAILSNQPKLTGLEGPWIPRDTGWYDIIATGGGSFLTRTVSDDRARIVAVHPVPGTSMAVSTAILLETALESWRANAMVIGGGTLLGVICATILLYALSCQFSRVLSSEASLAERETRLHEKSRELEQVNWRLDAALNSMSHGLCMFDRDGRLLVCNDRYRAMYRLSRDVTRPGATLRELLQQRRAIGTFSGDVEQTLVEVMRANSGRRSGQFTSEMADGRVIAVLNDPTGDGGWVSVHEDITERTRAAARIAHMARHDALTDLANRTLVRERMAESITRMEATGVGFAVLIFDIDLFKSVNDSLGHTAGDALLEAVADRLRRHGGRADTLGRIGGDEFAVIHVTAGDPRTGAATLAATLLRELRAPYEIEGKRIVIGISIGIAVAPQDGVEPSQILKSADLALYRAKADGRGCFRFFEPEMDADVRQQREFEFQLREAMVRQEFELHFQPIVELATFRPCAVEALVRWRHPERGLVPPDKFIPVAEEIGLIIPLGEWILDAACRVAAAWPSHIRLAVNLSAVQFRSGNLVEVVRGAIAASGLTPNRLELEITESVLLQKDQGTLAVLHELAALGVHIVLDDFGTGYSSLSYLQLFPFSKIKIDRSFVSELSSRSDCAAIVCTVMNLAKALDMTTTAEGVETWDQVALLRAAGCSEAQGWLFGRPGFASALSLDRALGPPPDVSIAAPSPGGVAA